MRVHVRGLCALFFLFLILPVCAFAGDKSGGGIAAIGGATAALGAIFGWAGAVWKYGRVVKNGQKTVAALMHLATTTQRLIKEAPVQLLDVPVFADWIQDADSATESAANVLDDLDKRDAARFLRDLIKAQDLAAVKLRLNKSDSLLQIADQVLSKAKVG